MNVRSLLLIAVSAFTVLMAPITALAKKNPEQTGSLPRPQKTPATSPLVNPPPPPPTPPSGPTWLPASREQYRFGLEQYRLNLEDFRKKNPTENIKEYTGGIKQYREGISSYRERANQIPH